MAKPKTKKVSEDEDVMKVSKQTKKIKKDKSESPERMQRYVKPHKPAIVKYVTEETPVGGYTKEQFEEFNRIKEDIITLTAKDLKNELARNHQPITGRKDELVDRVADGRLLGAIPKCPSCLYGYLHFDKDTGIYHCPGSYQEDHFARCGKNYNMDQIKREPWNL